MSCTNNVPIYNIKMMCSVEQFIVTFFTYFQIDDENAVSNQFYTAYSVVINFISNKKVLSLMIGFRSWFKIEVYILGQEKIWDPWHTSYPDVLSSNTKKKFY